MSLILVIDDEAAMRTIIRRMLRPTGHEVIEAADGEVGIAMLREHRPDLVITDIVMPNKEGLETIIEMRRACPGVKIVAMSGIAGPRAIEYLGWAKKLGADASLMKPFRTDDFREAIDGLLMAA